MPYPITDVRLVVDATAAAVEPHGFWREIPRLTVPDGTEDDYIAASWLRGRDDRPDRYNCDGLAVWTGGYITVGLAGGKLDLHWRDLTPDQVQLLVGRIVAAYDEAQPPILD